MPATLEKAEVDLSELEAARAELDLTSEPEQLELSFEVGGKAPTTTALSLVGGKIEVDSQFEKGERIVLRIEAEVGEIAFVDSRDPKTGQVIGCERRHKARITGVSVG